ncbi:MAG: SpoIIE family protein phosphatase [Pseudanabaenaceae cyanobacterium]
MYASSSNPYEDLTNGRLLQRSLLPQGLPVYQGLDIAAELWTAVDLGGDYYQFLEQSGTLAVAIADSSGKSVAGAIHAALFKGQLDAYAQQGRLQNPATVLTSLNKLLCKSCTEDAVALSYGALDLDSYELHLGNAGIPGPFIYRAHTGECEEIISPAIALGRYPDTTYRAAKRKLEEGDVVIFCSDGLFEAVNPYGMEFGEADIDGISPLRRAIMNLANCPATKILHGLKASLDQFTQKTVPDDDVSIVVIKVLKKVPLSAQRDCPFQEALQAWIRSEEKDDSALLRGARLKEALAWARNRTALSRVEQDFLEASKRIHEREVFLAQRAADADRLEKLKQELEKTLEAERQQRLIAEMGEINEKIIARTISSEALFLSNNLIEALIAGVIAGVQLRKLTTQVSNQLLASLKPNTQSRTVTALEQVVYGIHEYNRLEGHGFWVNRVVYHPSGKLIASASSDRTIRVWSASGEHLQTLTGHTNWVTCLAFSPDGKYLVSGSRDNMLKVWMWDQRSNSFNEVPAATLRGHEGPVLDVCFSPDGELIASASEDTTVRIWKTNGTLLKTFRGGHERWVQCVAFHPNGKMLVSGSADRNLIIWNMQGAVIKVLKGHDSFIESVAYDPKGEMIVSGSRDKLVKLWSADGAILKTFTGHTERVWGVAFSPDSKLLASASSDRTVRIWDVEHGLVNTFAGHGDVVNCVAFSPDAKYLASGSRDTTVKIWNIRGNPLRMLTGHSDEVLAVAVSPNGQYIATGGRDRLIYLWQANGTLIRTLEGHVDRVRTLAFSPDGEILVSGSTDATIRLWQVASGRLLETLSSHRAEVHQIAFRCDGAVFASCSSDSTVRIWTGDGRWLQTLTGHTSEVYGLAFSPDGSMLATVGKDRLILLWSWDGTLLRTLEGHSAEVTAVAFSPDGKLLASGSVDQSLKLWQVDGKLVKTLNGHSAEVTSVCFSPDGKAIVSASEDNTVQFWGIDGTLLRTFSNHKAPVKAVCFSPNGKTLFSASSDRSVILWNLDLDNLLLRGCQWLQEYLRTSTNVSEEDKRTCMGGCAWLYKYLKGESPSGATIASAQK